MTIQPAVQQTTTAHAKLATPEPKPAVDVAAKTVTVAKADSVTLSKQAVLMNSRSYSAGEEVTESPAAKAAEKAKGQR